MAAIRGSDTKPELLIRRGLHRLGFRYRLHARDLPGRPDLVFAKFRAVLFVHGCFWHGHDCHLFRMPATRSEFWAAKLETNRRRDREVREALTERAWRVLVIWECALKGKTRHDPEPLLDAAAEWIRGERAEGEIAGRTL